MIGIKVDNTFLDLGKTSISFFLQSPIFNTVGSYSYPFTFPATAKNKRLLGIPYRIIQHIYVSKSFDANIYLKNLPWKIGKIFIKSADKDYIKAYFTVGEGYFYNAIKDLKLGDIDLGGDRFVADHSGTGQNDIFSKAYTNLFPYSDFAIFPLRNNLYYEGADYSTTFQNDFLFYLNHYTKNEKLNTEGNTYVLFPYLCYLLQRIFDHLNIEISANELARHDDLKQLVIYNTVSASLMGNIGGVNINQVKDPFKLNSHLPEVTYLELFKSIENLFAGYAFIDETSQKSIIKLLTTIISEGNFNTFVNEQGYISQTDPPDDWGGYKIDWDNDDDDENSELNIESLEKYNFKGSVSAYADLPASGYQLNDLWFVENLSRYFVMKYFENLEHSGWYSISDPYTQFINKTGDFDIGIKASLREFRSSLGFDAILVPGAQQKGIVDLDSVEDSNFTLRYLFYRGMHNTENIMGNPPYLYPMATPSVYDVAGNQAGNASLFWHGSNGLYENFWKKPLQFHAARRAATIKKQLTVPEIRNLRFSEKYRFQNMLFLIDKVKFTASPDKISLAEIKVFTV